MEMQDDLISTFKMFEDELKVAEEVLVHYSSTKLKVISSNLWSNLFLDRL